MTRQEQIAFALDALSKPPLKPWIDRPEPQGKSVCRFFLPLELCKPQNAKRDAKIWNTQSDRKAIQQLMALQCRRRPEPLIGRPQVLCVRFSSVEPDRYSDWAKMAIDVLCAPSGKSANRLNIIKDDAPKYADVHQWWEPAPKGKGFVYIEVLTGKLEDAMRHVDELMKPKRTKKSKAAA